MKLKYCFTTVVLVFICFMGIITTSSQAEAASFNDAMLYSANPAATGIGGINASIDYYHVTTSVTPTAASYAQSGSWGSVNLSASADLSTGTLKMQGAALSGVDNGWPYVISNASFGDSFTTSTTTGTPFTWSASTATFNLALDGSFTSKKTTDPDTGYTSSGGAFALLAIEKKGTLDPNSVISSNTLQYFFWALGDPNQQVAYNDGQGHITTMIHTDSFDYIPTSLSATFAPGGDFDWVLLLGASGQVMNKGDFFDANLADTVKLSYVAPEGTVTTSDSGVFPGTTSSTSVPEPATMLLFSLGLLGLAGVRRKFKK